MDIKRRLARVISVFAVAILLGHLVQSMSENKAAETIGATPTTDPKTITPVAAGPQAAMAPAGVTTLPVLVAPATPAVQAASDTTASPAAVTIPASGSSRAQPLPASAMASMTAGTLPQDILPKLTLVTASPGAAGAPPAVARDMPAIVSETEPAPSIVPKAMQVLLQPEGSCQNEMDLAVVAEAIIEITLLAPCHPDERLVLRHGPLAITVRTTAQGSAFLKIPAMDADAKVAVRFADGVVISGAVQIPDLDQLQRFGVQWMDRDTFGVNAFENGSGYGEAGHISAANPGKLPLTGNADGGYLMILGDADATPAMLAEVYTYPTGITMPTEVSVEAQVTAETCGRELLGDVITSDAGRAGSSDLVLAMPDCSAIGDILVLKNPVQDLTLAVAN
jgi:hypothetical protein